MALDAGTLVFQVFSKDDPLGTALGTLTKAYDKSVTVEDNGIGSGSFRIHPDDTGASWCVQDNYVAAWRDTVSGDPIAGFWIDTVSEVVLSPDEGGGKAISVSGRGPIAILEEALVWHKAKSGTSATVYPAKGYWKWNSAHPSRPLIRLIEEAQERGCFPAVSLGFTRSKDSSGTAWSGDQFDEFSFNIGTNLLDVVRILRESGLHVTMDARLVLRAWDTYTNDLSGSIEFTEGVDIRDTSEIAAAARRGKSAVLVQGENKNDANIYRPVVNSTYEDNLGRRKEAFFGYQRTATTAILKNVGLRKLNKWKKQYDGPFTLGVIDTTDQVALVDYQPGDTVAVPTDYVSGGSERIASITLTETANGEYDPTLEFGDVSPDPFSGNYPTGDIEGAGCCGDAPGVSKKPTGGTTTTGGGGGGGGSSVPTVDPTPYTLDDFSRSGTTGPSSVASQPTADPGPIMGPFTYTIDLPDGADVVGRHLLALIAWRTPASVDVNAAMVALGWTKILASATTNGTYGANWFFRRVDGSEGFTGSGDSIDITVAATTDIVAHVDLLTNAYDEGPSNPGLWFDINPGTSADPDALTVTGDYAAGTSVRYYAALISDSSPITGTPAGYTPDGAADVDASIELRVCSKNGTNAAEDPTTFASTGPQISYTLRIRGGGITGWGSIPQGQGVDTDAPWEGGNTYLTEQNSGSGTFAVGDGVGTMEMTSDETVMSAGLWTSDEDDPASGPWGPWADGDAEVLVKWKVDPIGDTADTYENQLRLDAFNGSRRYALLIHLGDDEAYDHMDPDQQRGLVLLQGVNDNETYGTFVAKTLASDTWYYTRFDFRGDTLRARLWAASAAEPTSWDTTMAKADLAIDDTGQSFAITAYGNDGMLFSFDQIDAKLGALPGSSLGRHVVGSGDGTTVTFSTLNPFTPGTLAVWVDNQPVVPTSYDAAAGTFTLDRAPYGDPADDTGNAIVEAAYEVVGVEPADPVIPTGPVFGPGVFFDGKSNRRITSGLGIALVFTASRSSRVNSVLFQDRIGSGYSDGDLGEYAIEIQATTAGVPNGSVLGTAASWTPATHSENDGVRVNFANGPTLVSGTQYAIVWRNVHSTPDDDYISLNFPWKSDAGSQPRYPSDESLVYNGTASYNPPGTSWAGDDNHGPGADIIYANGEHEDVGLVAYLRRAGGTARTIAGTAKVRERFTPSEAVELSGAVVKVGGPGTNDLTISLKQDGITLRTHTVTGADLGGTFPLPGTSADTGTAVGGAWAEGDIALEAGSEYTLEMSSTGTYYASGIGARDSSTTSYDHQQSFHFSEGVAEYTTDGSTWLAWESAWTGFDNLQWYGTIAT